MYTLKYACGDKLVQSQKCKPWGFVLCWRGNNP